MRRSAILTLAIAAGAFGFLGAAARAQNATTPTGPQPTPGPNGIFVEQTENAPDNLDGASKKNEGGLQADSAAGANENALKRKTEVEPKSAKKPGGEGIRAIKAGPSRGATAQGHGPFEPALKNPIEYGDPPPEGGELLTNPGAGAPMAVTELLDQMVTATGWNVVTSPKIEGKTVRFWINKVTPQQALEILKFNGIYYHYSNETKYLYVSTVEEYLDGEFGGIKESDFTIKYADVADMETILTSLLSPGGRIVSDPRTAHILVWDTKDNIDQMKKTVARLDVPLQPKVFQLKYVNADALLESIQSLLTERGLAQADPRANALVVTDLPARIEQIGQMIASLDKKLETRTWTLSYLDPKDVAERIESLVPEEMGAISLDKIRHQLSITAIPARLDEIGDLIKTWDVKPLQVQIEAYLVSAGVTVARNLGIDWSYLGDKDGKPFGIQIGANRPDYNAQPTGTGQRLTIGSVPYQVPMFYPWTSSAVRDIAGNLVPSPNFKGNQVGVVLDYLDTHGDIRVLSRPRVTVEDGEQATFENTTDRPYQQGGYSQYGGATSVTDPNFNRVIPLQVEFIKVGTVLKVKPRINEEGNILMEISAEDSTADNVTVTTGDQKSTVPQKHQNKAQTKVLTHNGETIVIGGMRASSINDSLDKVPVFGDVPFLGRLFKNTKKDHQDRELMIFITATIVDEYTKAEATRLTNIEQGVTETVRDSEKPLLERVQSNLNKKNEIGVSIGQGGAIYSKGQPKTMDELKEDFAKVEKPKVTKVIIRTHPEAPAGLKDQVAQLAKDAGLRVEYDDRNAPFVPTLPAKKAPESRK